MKRLRKNTLLYVAFLRSHITSDSRFYKALNLKFKVYAHIIIIVIKRPIRYQGINDSSAILIIDTPKLSIAEYI